MQALGEVDALIREQPNNPYFWELKGALQYQAGQHKEAAPNLRKALQLAGGEAPLIQVYLAQALLADDKAPVDEALGLLRRAVIRDGDNSGAYRHLAVALARKGLEPQANLATAQAYFIDGNIKQAQIFAKRAQNRLSQGSPEWIKSEDIISYKGPAE
jgi:predicted Zn-dependent protease